MDLNSFIQKILSDQSLIDQVTVMLDSIDPKSIDEQPILGKSKEGPLVILTFYSKPGKEGEVKKGLEKLDDMLRGMKSEPITKKNVEITDVVDAVQQSGMDVPTNLLITAMGSVIPLVGDKKLKDYVTRIVKSKNGSLKTGIQVEGTMIKYKILIPSDKDIYSETEYIVNKIYTAMKNIMNTLMSENA